MFAMVCGELTDQSQCLISEAPFTVSDTVTHSYSSGSDKVAKSWKSRFAGYNWGGQQQQRAIHWTLECIT